MRANSYPSWFYGPNGESEVFESEDQVPAGWFDHPSKHGPAAPKAPAAHEQIDAHGWPWDAKLHAATKSLTSAGLWRMKVGVSRPAPKSGYPLDL